MGKYRNIPILGLRRSLIIYKEYSGYYYSENLRLKYYIFVNFELLLNKIIKVKFINILIF